jgi:glycosyltransferase involved in cell wall biosynthesis
MKILIVQDQLRSGGTERQSILLANAFAASGHATTLLTFRPGGALASTVASAVTRRVLQPFDTCFDWFAPRLYRGITATGPDVILCMGRMANCYAGGLQERFPSTAVIATMRTGKKLPRLFRRSLSIVRQVVANSHEAAATLVERYAAFPERVSVIHNSLVFSPAPESGTREKLRADHGATAKTAVLLCVAMFRPEKNQRELIEIVATKALGARVRFLGWQRDPTSLYAAADFAVHASSSEALSNFLIEAQASGLPAIAYDAQGIAECFVPEDTGFVIARDNRAAFCQKIVELAGADSSAQAARTERARQFARATFDHDQQIARYLELFLRLIPEQRS